MFKSSAIGQICARASGAFLTFYPTRQAAALCYRVQGGEIMVLLITSRASGRWGFPKGTIESGETSAAAAEREAFEEAGVIGVAFAATIGCYRYRKAGFRKQFDVKIHALEVTCQAEEFPERGQRQISWFTAAEAALVVDNAALKHLVRRFAPARLAEEGDGNGPG